MQFLSYHHFANERVNGARRELKHLRKLLQAHRVIINAVGKQIRSETFFLDFSSKHSLYLITVVKLIPDWEAQQSFFASFPISFTHLLGSRDNDVFVVFWWSTEYRKINSFKEFVKMLADHLLLDIVRVGCNVRNLEQQCTNQMDRFNKVQIDVHVVR